MMSFFSSSFAYCIMSYSFHGNKEELFTILAFSCLHDNKSIEMGTLLKAIL